MYVYCFVNVLSHALFCFASFTHIPFMFSFIFCSIKPYNKLLNITWQWQSLLVLFSSVHEWSEGGEGVGGESRGYTSIPSQNRKHWNYCDEWQETCKTTKLSDTKLLFILLYLGSRSPDTFAFVSWMVLFAWQQNNTSCVENHGYLLFYRALNLRCKNHERGQHQTHFLSHPVTYASHTHRFLRPN